jgi:DNA-binding response OmpR family regulator
LVAATGEEGFFLASEGSFDLLLLDLMLPRRDGIDVLTICGSSPVCPRC